MLGRDTYLWRRLYIRAGILFDTELRDNTGLRAQEPEGKEDKLSREVFF